MCLNLTDVEIYKNIKEFYKCEASDIKIKYNTYDKLIDIKIKNENNDYKHFWKYIKKKYNIDENEETKLFIYLGHYPTEYKENNVVMYNTIRMAI